MAYYMASVSWGKDSLAMLLRLIYENKPLNEVVFFDTGMEFQAIYNVRNAALGMLKVRGITYTELKPAKPFLYTMLDKPVKGRDRKGYPMLKEALKVIEAWGFKYKRVGFQWVKQNRSGNGYFFGLGRWTRGNTEPCLIAVKGKPHRASNSVSQLIFAPLRAHSQKPDITRDKIRELMGGSLLHRAFCKEYNTRLGCLGKRGKQVWQLKYT